MKNRAAGEFFPSALPSVSVSFFFYDCENCNPVTDTARQLISVFGKYYSFAVTKGAAGLILANVKNL